MKRTLSLITACALCLALAACGSSRESAETVVSKAIEAFQSADQAAIASYWGGELQESPDIDADAETSESDQQIMAAIAKNLTYTITSSEEDEEAGTAVVSVDFTNIDMAQVMVQYISELFSVSMEYAFLPEDQQPTDEELEQIYLDTMTSVMEENADNTVTNSVDIHLTLVDDAWTIDADNAVVDAMVGGLFSFATSSEDPVDP